MWQIEFTLHVTWCSSTMRASPAQSSAVSAPPIAPDSVQPRKNGAASEKIANAGNSRLMIARVGVVEQIGRVARRRRDVALEQPADVRVREAAELRAHARAVQVRRVRIAGLVAEDVVAAVVRDPTDERTFDRERTGRREHDLQPARGTEAAMREEAVVADGDAEAAHEVEAPRR